MEAANFHKAVVGGLVKGINEGQKCSSHLDLLCAGDTQY